MSPVLNFPPELLLRAQEVRLALFDVDGVLTDGGLHYGDAGEVVKRFHTLDGHGLKLLAHAGIAVAVISGRDSAALRRRLHELGIDQVHCGVSDKRAVAEQVLAAQGLSWTQVAAIGDDWPDLPLLRRAALACAPPQAHAEVRALAHHVTYASAGAGCAREFCDLLLVARGRYAGLLAEHAA